MTQSSEEQPISPAEGRAGNAGLDELSLALARQRELEEALRKAVDLIAHLKPERARFVLEQALLSPPTLEKGKE